MSWASGVIGSLGLIRPEVEAMIAITTAAIPELEEGSDERVEAELALATLTDMLAKIDATVAALSPYA